MPTPQGNRFQQIEIGLASPKEIKSWAERFLPNGEIVGEVTTWETVNYKTLKPEANGLFCQKIFGPVVDYTCACGKKALKVTTGFCPKCGVERTSSQVRRYRMGYIKLKQPVAHTLYASQKPSPLGLCLNWSNKRLQAVLYGTEFCHLPDIFEFFMPGLSLEPPNMISKPTRSILNLSKQAQKSRKQGFELRDAWPPQIRNSLLLDQLAPASTQQKRRFEILAPTSLPRLFTQTNKLSDNDFKNLNIKSNKQKLRVGIHLYGIGYDMTWRQVEDFQDFLLYIWEQANRTDQVISYYQVTQKYLEYTNQTIPSHIQYYPLQTGGFVLQKMLAHWNLIGSIRQLALDLDQIQTSIKSLQWKQQFAGNFPKSESIKLTIEINRFKQLEKKILRRITYFRDFQKAQMQPAWMILSYLPVLPPGLRPITSIRGELVVSDLNSLYRKVLTRNRRLTNTTKFGIFDTALSGSWASWCYNLRQVQEAVDSLLKTGKVDSGKTTKSLLDSLKGKRGRFRQHLLGKRVDYSGRSVIVVGPNLKIHECGLPKQMVVELFQPFLIQQLRNKGIAFTTTGAKAVITERKPIIWTLLREILQSHPVFLNRAPTLHRLGIQAFIPKLVDGKAILLHPLVCPAFNADFDGDQMAVHIPLSTAARAEAFNLLLARNHLLAPSSGDPLLLPTQDMVLGCYYLTLTKENIESTSREIEFIKEKKSRIFDNFKTILYYTNFADVLEDYHRGYITAHSTVWAFWDGDVQTALPKYQSRQRSLVNEIRLDISGRIESFSDDKYENFIKKAENSTFYKYSYIRTTPGRIMMHHLLTTAI